jgi:hypothetical protein
MARCWPAPETVRFDRGKCGPLFEERQTFDEVGKLLLHSCIVVLDSLLDLFHLVVIAVRRSSLTAGVALPCPCP